MERIRKQWITDMFSKGVSKASLNYRINGEDKITAVVFDPWNAAYLGDDGYMHTVERRGNELFIDEEE